jgi:hypothetical protein
VTVGGGYDCPMVDFSNISVEPLSSSSRELDKHCDGSIKLNGYGSEFNIIATF